MQPVILSQIKNNVVKLLELIHLYQNKFYYMIHFETTSDSVKTEISHFHRADPKAGAPACVCVALTHRRCSVARYRTQRAIIKHARTSNELTLHTNVGLPR